MPPAEVAEMGQVIYSSGKRLEHLVENFLIYAQLELLRADKTKIASLRARKTVKAVETIEKHARVQAEVARRQSDLQLALEPVAMPISEEYLGRIVDELVQNAFKFSDPGAAVSVVFAERSGSVSLTVHDFGRGFSTEQITRVGAYMQFDRKLHEQQGLGLGLSISKRLAELHGGTLTIESRGSSGTAVTVKLPQAEA